MRLLAVASSRRKLLSGGSVGLAAATIAGFAFVTPGYPTADLHLNDGGVWVTNGSQLLVGRLNHQIQELDASLTSAANDVDVAQEGLNVLAVEPATGTLQKIDVSYVSLGTDVKVPEGARIGLGGGHVTVLDPAGGRLWMRSVDQIGALDVEAQKPGLTLGPGGDAAVGQSGVVAAVSPRQHRLTIVAADGGMRSVPLPQNTKSATVTVVGDSAVVLDADHHRLITDDGATHDLGRAAGAVLQQPGPAADGVLVATDAALLSVPLGGGGPSTLAEGSGGPVAPVRVGDCAHAAWTAKPTYTQICTGKPRFSTAIPRANPGARLRFRVNRNVVVLNELQTGDVWLLDQKMTLANNWDAVRPPDPQNASDQKPDQFDDNQKLQRNDQNRPPVAKPDEFGARPGLPTLLPVLDNDSDPDGDVLTISALDGPGAGQGTVAAVDDSREVQFTSAPGATGSVTFRYTIDDGRGGTDSAQVTVDIHPFSENSPPKQIRATQTVVVQGGTVVQRVLTDWIDPDGDELSLVGAHSDTADTVRFTADGAVTYIDSGTQPGRRDITLDVSDGKDVGHGTLVVEVRPPGELPPTARGDHVTTFVNQPVTVSPLQNDTDPNQDQLRLSGLAADDGLTVTPDYVKGTFTAAAPVAKTYYVVYTVVDGPDSAQGLVRVDVLPGGTNTPPVAVRDLAFVPSAGSTTVDVLANDIDVDGDVLVVTGVSVPTGSGLSVSVRDHRFLAVSAAALLPGPVTVTYTVSDGSATAQGGVIVRSVPPNPQNQPPLAQPDTGTVRAGDVLTLDVLANDSDPDGDPLTLVPQLAEPPSAGSMQVVAGKLHVVAPSEPGTVRAIYKVADSTGQTSSSLVTIYVRPADGQNSPPTPSDLTARVLAGSDTRIDVPLSGIDPDGDSVHVVGIASAPTKGRISQIASDHLVYQAYEATGTDSFQYVVEDRLGARGTATVRVGIAPRTPGNQPPVAQDDKATTRPGRTVSVDVLANDSDPDGDPLSFTANPFTNVGRTKVSLAGGRVQVVAPSSGQATIGYTITDGRGGTATGYLTVTADAQAPLQPPVAVDDVVSADTLVPGSFVPVNVLANDYDPDGSTAALKVRVPTGTANARVDATGRVLVRGAPAAQEIPYTITDVDGQSAMALILVPSAANLPPRLKSGASPQIVKSAGATWALSDLVEDPEGHAVKLTGGHITATNSDGSNLATDATHLRFVPAANYSGPASLSFEVTDGSGPDDPHGQTTLLTLALTVKSDHNQAPSFAGASLSPSSGDPPVSLDLAPLAKDAEHDKLSFALPASLPAGFDVKLSGSTLTVGVAGGTAVGTIARLDMTVSDGHNPPQPAPVDLVVKSSSKPLARAVPDTAQADQGKSVTVDVLANDANPFPGTPLKLTVAQVMSGTGTAAVDGSKVTVTPGSSFVGDVTVQYTVRDKTGDASRDVTGLLTVTVRGVPSQPVAPSVLEVRDSTVVLSWASPAANGAPIEDYHVRSSGVDQTCPTTTCTISGLTNGTTYTFTVTARNAVGESPQSPQSGPARPDNQPDPPAAPVLTFGDGQLKADWTVPHNTGTPISHYEVEISPGGAAVSATGTSYTFTGLTNGQSYQVRVRAFNGAPSPSDWSAYSAPEVPAGVPATPAPPTASVAGGPIGGLVDVQWTQPATNGANIDSYTLEVFQNGASQGTHQYSGGTTSAELSEANANDYTFKVSATNKAGTSAQSPASSAVHPYSQPAAIASVNAVEGDHQVTLNFTAPNDGGQAIQHYEAQWSGGSATISGPGAVITGLNNGTSYAFQVRACNTYCGAWSPNSNTVVPYGPPPAPGVSGSGGLKSVTFNWSQPGTNGRPLDHMEISIDSGGWQNVGLGSGSRTVSGDYNGHSIQVRAVDNTGQAGAIASTSASPITPVVTVYPDGAAPACTGCSYIAVRVSGIAPGSYTFVPNSRESSSGFIPYTINVDGNGNGSVTGNGNRGDWYGYPSGWVSATVDGITGIKNPWGG